MRKLSAGILVLLSFFLLLWAVPAFGEEAAPKGDKPTEEVEEPVETPEGIRLNFDGWDMRKAVEYLAKKLKKPILYTDNLGGSINYVSYVPIKSEDLVPVFETILNLNGWQMVEVAGMIKIIPLQQDQGIPAAFYTPEQVSELRARDRIITQVLKLKHLDANTAMTTLGNFSISRTIVAVPQTNSLVVTDYETVILRLTTILNTIDVPGPKIIHKVVPLKHANVDTLKTYIDSYITTVAKSPYQMTSTTATNPRRPPVQQPSPQATSAALGSQMLAIPDPRTNSFILIGTVEEIAQIEAFIADIDRESTSSGNYHVVRLQNIPAKDLATTLNDAFAKAVSPKGEAEQKPVIIAFEGQNSLIVLASQAQFEEIRGMIEQLDKPQMQVLIRTVIVEVTTTKLRELGIEFASGDFPVPDGYRGFTSTFGTTNKYVVPGVSGTLPGGSGISLGIVRDRNGVWAIPALLQAVQSDKDIELLAEPQILATDNEDAELIISEKIPYSTISNTNTTSSTSTATYGGDYEASIKLKITPHIRSKDYLTLEVSQTVEQFFKSDFSFDTVSGTEANRPAKSVREATTRVGVPNRGYVVIGGMTRTKTDETITKVPWLGDIPGIGHLFRKSSRSVEKVNLYIFLQPEIISEPGELVSISEMARVDLERLRRSRANRDPLAKTVFKGMNDEPKVDNEEKPAEDKPRPKSEEEPDEKPRKGDGEKPRPSVK
ncbi:MAG: type II secretion system secretin GspD [Planctomycetota bacterium]